MRVSLILLAFASLGYDDADSPEEATREHRYARSTSRGKTPECTFTFRQAADGWSIRGVTGSLTVFAAYDKRDHLVSAVVTQATPDDKITTRVAVEDSIATITWPDGQATKLKVPVGVIVTSAPDWSDIYLMCRRYDRARGGKQTFPGLWLHPAKGAKSLLRLTFTCERVGADVLEIGGKKRKLERFSIVLRNQNEYTVWADETGKLTRLRPGTKGKAAYEITLE